MITWIQKRKKFVVGVMAVTTFAFVGAGFVGWGSYDYGAKSGNIAKVGEIGISGGEYQQQYNNIHNYYSKMFEGQLTDDQIAQLKEVAFTGLVNQAYMLNLANELEMIVSEEEIANEIATQTQFHKEGKFDKATYLKVLNSARQQAKEYEASVSKQLLIEKISEMINLPITQGEQKTVAASIFMADKLSIKVLTDSDVKIDIADAEIKAYYESHKLNYMGEPSFDVSYIKVSFADMQATIEDAKNYFDAKSAEFTNPEGKLLTFEEAKDEAMQKALMKKAKKTALKQHVALKKGKATPSEAKGISYTNKTLPLEVMQTIESQKIASVSKPVASQDAYYVARVDRKYDAKPLPYEAVKFMAANGLKADKMKTALNESANAQLEAFKGENIGFVTRDDVNKLTMLSPEEASQFLGQLFSSKSERGVIELAGKVVLFHIMEQKLFDEAKYSSNGEFISSNTEKLKKSLLDAAVIKQLSDKYSVSKFYQGI
jgi:peptidyl-prolyl cis-trans isomerase D